MIVGITQRVDNIESYNEVRDALDQRLVDWILKAEFLPVLIPNRLANLDNIEIEQSIIFEWLKKMRIDVILLSGGNDIGKEPHRDLLERSLLYWAEKNKKPVLGICRGMQMLGVYFGSKLIDVKGHVGTKHKLKMNSTNKNLYPAEVNSYHNQALKDCPKEFKVIAKANDGNIEAIIHKKLPWEGWMWHPERDNEFNSYGINRIKQLFNM
jgi:N5-(cytidine 5'-diphosphoramidyl)-L-glutamine hydrolase